MSKNSFFTGQPIFSQILKFISRDKVLQLSKKHSSDRYCKRFSTYEHLVTLMYAILNNCDSLREVVTGMLAWEQKLAHLGMASHPRRSTLSDANSRRSAAVFEDIYLSLLEKYGSLLPDSRSKKKRGLYIIDSTTITLFQQVLTASGLKPTSGKQKGGVKVHTLMRADQDVPAFVRFSSAVGNDSQFLKEINLPEGSIILFDRGYNDYSAFNRFTRQAITWITRRRSRAVFKCLKERSVSESQSDQGVLSDTVILLGHDHQKSSTKVKCRLIVYKDKASGETYEFFCNNLKLSALSIASLYRKRWQIEVLFKRLKQNYPLKYFLGDSENAIKVQIWCTLIVDLLLKLIKNAGARKWSFSNLASMIRLHLMTYIDLFAFLKSPEKCLIRAVNHKRNTTFTPSLFDG